MRVMVLDDFATMRTLLRSLLSQLDFEDISEGQTVEDGLIAVKNESADLVICDYSLKDGSALDFLDAVIESGKDCPILVMCASSEKSQAEQCLEKGASGLLVKPFTARALGLKINKMSNKRKNAS